jgi:hypothetical protein
VGGSGACADIVKFRGTTYSGLAVTVSAIARRMLGTAVGPRCDDTGGQLPTPPGERFRVAQLPGVSPSVAIVPLNRNDVVYIRADRTKPPPEVMRLRRTPRCVSTDAPISLRGPWLGILEPNGDTETDLVPPYDLSLLVRHTSSARYARAFLDVRVPASMGRPITEPELRASLLHGGTIAITVTCRSGRYVATRVETAPPA